MIINASFWLMLYRVNSAVVWIEKHGCDPVVIADVVLLVCGRSILPDLSLCLLHEPDSGQPFLCEPQSSGET